MADCSANRRDGVPCTHPALKGQSVCGAHGGRASTPDPGVRVERWRSIADGQLRWHLVDASNGQVMADGGQGYSDVRDLLNGIHRSTPAGVPVVEVGDPQA